MGLAPENGTSETEAVGSSVTAVIPARWRSLVSGRVLRVALVAAVVLPVAIVAGSAYGAKQPTTAQLLKQIDAQQAAAEAATEKFNAIQAQYGSIKKRVSAAQSRLGIQQKQVDLARKALGQIAAERYRQGNLAGLSLLLSNNPDAVLAQSGLLASVSDREASAIERFVQAQRNFQMDNADLLAQNDRLKAAVAAAQAAKHQAEQKVAASKVQLNALTAAQRAQYEQASRGNARPGMTCAQAGIPPVSARVQKVLSYACAHLGDPYQWAAAGPHAFDCSGLTMMAWREAGVDLPHLASAQYADGTHISLSEAQPGDLVFRPGLGHVGIYLGNHLFLHAPHTGTDVQIAEVSSDMFAARY